MDRGKRVVLDQSFGSKGQKTNSVSFMKRVFLQEVHGLN